MDDKVVSLVEKLLRLAAPSSGTTDHERVSAALEAARLIEEHDLEVIRRPIPEPLLIVPSPWTRSIAIYHWYPGCRCYVCRDAIDQQLIVWTRSVGRQRQFRHMGCGGWGS